MAWLSRCTAQGSLQYPLHIDDFPLYWCVLQIWPVISSWVTCGIYMMTSSNGNIFRITGHLCGKFTGPRWIARTKASDAELWCFLLIYAWINNWVNNREAGDLRRQHGHYDVIVMYVWYIAEPAGVGFIHGPPGWYLDLYVMMTNLPEALWANDS